MLNRIQPHGKDDVSLIAEAIFNKNKLGFRYAYRGLVKQARYFSPAYRDFILKIIKNGSLKIVPTYDQGFFMDLGGFEANTSLSKRRKICVVTNISNPDTLGHELGHAVDMWFGSRTALSSHVLLEGDKTLNDIFLEEFESKHDELYELVMKEYQNIIASNINKHAYQILMANFDKYRELMEMENKKLIKHRKRLQKELYECGFVEVYYQLITKKCHAILNQKYGPILDALSAKYNFSYFYLLHHDQEYYQLCKNRLVQEFFANLFAAKVTGKHVYIDNLIKYLPRSFNAFEKLFVIIYDHLQNNKRFTDVKIKEVN